MNKNHQIHNFDEKVVEIQNLFNEPHSSKMNIFDRGLDAGIIAVLDILEIKIAGVNE